ncbi:MAG: hypothetical protein ACK4MM_03445 [Fervidobacterium sp.]
MYNFFSFFFSISSKVFCFVILLFLLHSGFAQTIFIEWYYDENAAIEITEQTRTVSIGTIYIYSNDKFRVYSTYQIVPKNENENLQIQVTSIKIGKTSVSLNPSAPTRVTNKWLYGTLSIDFLFLSTLSDFSLILSFVFLPPF